jgi:hypothetical protein
MGPNGRPVVETVVARAGSDKATKQSAWLPDTLQDWIWRAESARLSEA